MPAGRPPLPTEKRRVQIGLLVSPEARARLRRLAEDRGISQNRVVEALIMQEKHSGNGSGR
jgi:RecB family endonuclease NucS